MPNLCHGNATAMPLENENEIVNRNVMYYTIIIGDF